MSILLIGAGTVAYFTKGFKYHIDFAGGSELRVTFAKEVQTENVRKALSDAGYKDAIIQKIGTAEKSFIIQLQGNAENLGNKIYSELKNRFADNQITMDSVDWIGPEVGKEVKFNAIISVLLALLIILLYITIRSKYRFAVGAVAALIHDLLAVLAVLLILGESISVHVLAAILTVIGYSLNDTIVIFSRIRENMKLVKDKTEEELVDLSINQVLRRTLLTSFSTLIAVTSIFLLGGDSLRGFSLAMLAGIIVGTYSSIYIASPIMLAIKSSQKNT